VKKIVFVLGLFLLAGIAPAYAELPSKMRDNFSDIVKEYCHSTVLYDIEDVLGTWDGEKWSEEGKAYEFHKTVGCLFDSALQELTEQSKFEVQGAKSFSGGGKQLLVETFIPKGDCLPQFLSVTQGTQEANEFVSQCEKSETPEISQEYSSCRVSETVLQEWCGYDLFLYAKMQDEESFYKQKYFLSREEMAARFAEEKDRLDEERIYAEKTVMDTLQWYQEAESATRQTFWVVALTEELDFIQRDWGKLRSALGTFVDKFLNAAIPPE
jgi:hypothetical protein